MTRLDPPCLLELTVDGAHGVGVQTQPARQLACAGQALAGAKIAAQNREQQLAHELLAYREIAVPGDPEPHRVAGSYTDTSSPSLALRLIFAVQRVCRPAGTTLCGDLMAATCESVNPTDLSAFWMLLPSPERQTFFTAAREELDPLDAHTLMRARGWALVLGLAHLADAPDEKAMSAVAGPQSTGP